ncbi:MAG: UDP-N-acetylmuramoyl-L-alanyl-D-glutamate--2,6-diaminopimelate ligase [Gammaproteobacteria bacterium]|nr:UDP-N-acetylmuramoyl-L-alanyl-D-glutamate--2,6-diaminopimelate ligase [Gammaproteobacteria bacterium]MCW5582704.1 UDP-N-acetylmuramoyl-L-alanyl-D-glutamate--2,6-diaminopimelate ligase [Gammaproteobacteria bacterium]
MRLLKLLEEDGQIPTQADREVMSVALDSRQTQANSLFFALKGTQRDGEKYILDAISRGATAVLMEAKTVNAPLTWHENVPLIPIYQLQQKIGKFAARFYGHPASKMRMIGVTGTSGKTSCTHFIAQILQALNVRCGLIGTLGSGFYGALDAVGLTTPDAVTLQSRLAQFVDQGAQTIAMEISSHSINQDRIAGIEFDTGIFTNLTQDHLDYHGDMEAYANVKRRFLAEFPVKQVVMNADDSYGRKWTNELLPYKSITAYCTRKSLSISSNVPLVYTKNVEMTLQGIRAFVFSPWGNSELLLPLMGQFNLSNSLAALAALCLYGVPFSDVVHHLSQLKTVPGRMQTVGGGRQPLIVVDYAHKPDALEKVLQALRLHTAGKLFCVFGCGGERDRGKRQLMAKIAEQLADQVIVTNDNPRHEKPEDIASDIMQGFSHPERVLIELDRSKAIQNSIQWASAKDCILIAGKGAERYQQIGDEKIPFDDMEKVKETLSLSAVTLAQGH